VAAKTCAGRRRFIRGLVHSVVRAAGCQRASLADAPVAPLQRASRVLDPAAAVRGRAAWDLLHHGAAGRQADM